MKHKAETSSGFNVVELLVVILTFSVLAVLVIPALARTDSSRQTFQCMNNHKRLLTGWMLYAEDMRGFLVFNPGSPAPTTPAWVRGNMQNPSDATNTDLIKTGLLFPYVKSLDAYKCPANGRSLTRHISINTHMAGGGNYDAGYPTYKKINQIPKPSELFATIDESEISVNDGSFFIQGQTVPRVTINDWPGNAHEGGGVIGFADGRADVHVWRYLGAPPQGYNPNFGVALPVINNSDGRYLVKISTLPVSGSW